MPESRTQPETEHAGPVGTPRRVSGGERSPSRGQSSPDFRMGPRLWMRVSLMVLATLMSVSVPMLVRLVTLNSRRLVARYGSRASQLWSRSLCRIIGIRVTSVGAPSGNPFVVASNHVSYLDILVLGSLYPSQFVAKREIRSWPLFGWISRAAGTLFVDRDNPRDAVRVIRRLRKHLADGTPITLFPEGGTSPGDSIRPFLPTLLEPAAGAGVPCYAASLTYETPESVEPPSETVCWHDGSNFVRHILRVMEIGRIDVTVRFSGSPVRSADRKWLARRLWEDATASFVPIRSEPLPRRCAR